MKRGVLTIGTAISIGVANVAIVLATHLYYVCNYPVGGAYMFFNTEISPQTYNWIGLPINVGLFASLVFPLISLVFVLMLIGRWLI